MSASYLAPKTVHMIATASVMDTTTTSARGSEQRTSTRYQLAGEAEVFWDGSGPVVAEIKNISLGGCYLQTGNPLPQQAPVRLRLRIETIAIEIEGTVRRTDAGGFAVEFSSASPILAP